MPSSPVVQVTDLSRFYQNHLAIKDLSFSLNSSEVLGFLGPNGAGKSTTMQILTGNLAPSEGQVSINGFDIIDSPREAKRQTGYLPEHPPLYREASVDEYLRYCAQLRGIDKQSINKAIDESKQQCGLGGVGRRLIGNLSKGYQQRVGIAQAIIHNPPVVILDEPTVGLDPIQMRDIRSLIKTLQNTSILVIASPQTALLPGEVSLLKDYIGKGGNLLWLADPGTIISPIDHLADALAIEFLPGIVVGPNSQLLGLDRVDFALVAEYPRHPITQHVESLSIYPQAQAMDYHGDEMRWESLNFLLSDESSWNETGELKGEIHNGDDGDEINGPLNIGLTLSRSTMATSVENKTGSLEQRIAVVGDADFLSNNYIGTGANLELGLNLFSWLSHDDNLISISPRAAPDTRLELSQTQQLIIVVFFLIILPLLLIGLGLRICLKRRSC
jgi:ABC-type Na+ transport system ATPase subunit NatA